MAEVYVGCALLVVERDSDIVLVSDEEKLLNVLVSVLPLVDVKKLERVDSLDVSADAVNVEWVGTPDGILDSMLLVCLNVLADVGDSVDLLIVMFLVAPAFSDVVSIVDDAEVYVGCGLLVVKGDSDIVFVSDADKLFNVLVGISLLVDENILEREELVDVAEDAVEWGGTPDGVLDSMLLVCLNVLADVADSVDLLIVMFSVAPEFSDVVSIVDDAEVYVGCGLLVVEDDSDIVLVSDADKLLNVLVSVLPLVDVKRLERVDSLDLSADAVNVEWVGTPDGVVDSTLLVCLNVLADVGDSVDMLIVMFLVAPAFSDVVSIVDDAEVYVGCGLLVVEDDSDIVLVSVADKLLNVLVAFSPLVDEKILERVELVVIAADAVNVDWVGTLD